MAAWRWSMPKPLRFLTSKCFNTLVRAETSAKAQSSSSKTKYFPTKRLSNFPFNPRSTKISFGENPARSLSIYSTSPSATRYSPVEMSSNDSPTSVEPKWMAARKLFSLLARTLSPKATPGVTNSVMPRFTSFLVSFGSSSWSQMATRCPARMRRGR